MHAQKYVRKGLRPAMNHLDCKHWFPRQSQRGGPCQHNGDTRTTRRVHKRTRRSHCLNGLLITSLLKSTSYNLSQRKQRVDNGCSIDAPLPVFVRQRKQFAPSGGRNACADRVWRALTRGLPCLHGFQLVCGKISWCSNNGRASNDALKNNKKNTLKTLIYWESPDVNFRFSNLSTVFSNVRASSSSQLPQKSTLRWFFGFEEKFSHSSY